MRIGSTLPVALLVATLALPAGLPAGSVQAASVGGRIGAPAAAPAAMPKGLRKLLDYVGCIGAIAIVKDQGSLLGAVAVCGNTLRTWWEE